MDGRDGRHLRRPTHLDDCQDALSAASWAKTTPTLGELALELLLAHERLLSKEVRASSEWTRLVHFSDSEISHDVGRLVDR